MGISATGPVDCVPRTKTDWIWSRCHSTVRRAARYLHRLLRYRRHRCRPVVIILFLLSIVLLQRHRILRHPIIRLARRRPPRDYVYIQTCTTHLYAAARRRSRSRRRASGTPVERDPRNFSLSLVVYSHSSGIMPVALTPPAPAPLRFCRTGRKLFSFRTATDCWTPKPQPLVKNKLGILHLKVLARARHRAIIIRVFPTNAIIMSYNNAM